MRYSLRIHSCQLIYTSCWVLHHNHFNLPWRVVYLRLDNVRYIKHPLQVKVRDHMPSNSVQITILHPLLRELWPGWKGKGFLRCFPLWARFQHHWAVTPKGGRVGTVGRRSDGKTDILSNLHWWAGEDLIILFENEEMSWGSLGTSGIWNRKFELNAIPTWAAWYLKKGSLARPKSF